MINVDGNIRHLIITFHKDVWKKCDRRHDLKSLCLCIYVIVCFTTICYHINKHTTRVVFHNLLSNFIFL